MKTLMCSSIICMISYFLLKIEIKNEFQEKYLSPGLKVYFDEFYEKDSILILKAYNPLPRGTFSVFYYVEKQKKLYREFSSYNNIVDFDDFKTVFSSETNSKIIDYYLEAYWHVKDYDLTQCKTILQSKNQIIATSPYRDSLFFRISDTGVVLERTVKTDALFE